MRIRLADPDRDAAQVAGIYRSAVEGSVASFEEVAPGADEMADRIRRTIFRTPWLVAEEDEPAAIVGYAYAASGSSSKPGTTWPGTGCGYRSPRCLLRSRPRCSTKARFPSR